MDVTTRAVATAASAALLAVGAVVGELALSVLVGATALGIAVGWPGLLRLPSRWGAALVVGLGGLGAVVVVHLTEGEPTMRHVPAVFAAIVLLAFAHELVRPGRLRVVESVTGAVTGALVAATAATWIAGGRTTGGTSLVVVGSVALAVGAALSVLPLRQWLALLVTVVGAVAGGLGVAVVMPDVPPGPGALVGMAVGVLVAALRLLFAGLPALRRRLPAVSAVLLPVAVSGAVVYVVGRVLVG